MVHRLTKQLRGFDTENGIVGTLTSFDRRAWNHRLNDGPFEKYQAPWALTGSSVASVSAVNGDCCPTHAIIGLGNAKPNQTSFVFHPANLLIKPLRGFDFHERRCLKLASSDPRA